MSLDYDLFVLNPENKDSTPEQIRDCIYDAIDRLAECVLKLHNQLNPTKCGVGGANATKTPPPLIKDKKIRKAVRAWYELFDTNQLGKFNDDKYIAVGYNEFYLQSQDKSLTYTFDLPFIDEEQSLSQRLGLGSEVFYTIAELCGSEE